MKISPPKKRIGGDRMPLIKYVLDPSTRSEPSGITDGGYFSNSAGELIGIGSTSSGTEISKDDLHTYVLAIHNSVSSAFKWGDDGTDGLLGGIENNTDGTSVLVNNYTEAEVRTMVDQWCSERGIS